MQPFQCKQKGFALLIVLVAVVILMMLTFVQIDTLFGPGLRSQPAGIEEHPWVLENLLVEEGQEIKLPRSPKLLLNEPVHLTAPVHRNEEKRGTLDLTIDTDGRILGQWECTYEQTGTEYKINAEMNGNIDVKRTFRDEQGKDKSRLFFIARGGYMKTPLDETAAGGERGIAWLTGWIGPDRRVLGHVTITTNREWAAAYEFEGGK
jgi:hypothetical protein